MGGASTRCACDSDTAPTDAEQGDDGSGRRSSTISLSEAARLELEAESQRRSSLPTGRRTSGVEVSESLSSSVKMPLAEETDEQLAHATADDGAGVGGGRPDDLSHLAAIAGAGPHDSITLTIEAPAPPSPIKGGGGGAGRKMTELDPRFNPDLPTESAV